MRDFNSPLQQQDKTNLGYNWELPLDGRRPACSSPMFISSVRLPKLAT